MFEIIGKIATVLFCVWLLFSLVHVFCNPRTWYTFEIGPHNKVSFWGMLWKGVGVGVLTVRGDDSHG